MWPRHHLASKFEQWRGRDEITFIDIQRNFEAWSVDMLIQSDTGWWSLGSIISSVNAIHSNCYIVTSITTVSIQQDNWILCMFHWECDYTAGFIAVREMCSRSGNCQGILQSVENTLMIHIKNGVLSYFKTDISQTWYKKFKIREFWRSLLLWTLYR